MQETANSLLGRIIPCSRASCQGGHIILFLPFGRGWGRGCWVWGRDFHFPLLAMAAPSLVVLPIGDGEWLIWWLKVGKAALSSWTVPSHLSLALFASCLSIGCSFYSYPPCISTGQPPIRGKERGAWELEVSFSLCSISFVNNKACVLMTIWICCYSNDFEFKEESDKLASQNLNSS